MALSVIEGKAWKFGDNISTDYMMPGFGHGKTPEEIAAFCMRANRPEFAGEVRRGDLIVAGKNFGCGSSKPAVNNLIALGVSCVIAESFGRLFFRNAISLGFPLLECKGVYDAVNEGDRVQVNLESAEVNNLTTGTVLKAERLPEVMMKILSAGGMAALLKEEFAE